MTRIKFLIFSAVIVAAVLLLSHQATVIHAERAEHEHELERARIERQAELQAERERAEQAEAERQELRQMLVNRVRTYEIVAAAPQDHILSRSGRDLTAVTMPATMPSGFDADVYEAAFKHYGASNLYGLGDALVEAEAEYGVNGLVLAAILVHESWWGRSEIAVQKNNLAGIGAYDAAPLKYAHAYDSKADSIFALAKLLREQYLTPGGHSANGDTLIDINKRYATDQGWARKVGAVMGTIARAGIDNPGELLAAVEVTT